MPPLKLLPAVVAVLSGCVVNVSAPKPGFDLPYPPKEKPAPGTLFHVPTGLQMPFEGVMDVVSGARLVCVGEIHDNPRSHEAELAVIRELQRRFPGQVAIGMEMFRVPQQEALDRWTKGELTEAEFLAASDWAHGWGSDFALYRGILDFARDNHLDVVALNPPEEQQAEARKGAGASLPDVKEADPYERAQLKAIYGGHLKTDEAFDAFLRVQLLWEESMASRVVEYLASPRGEGKRIVTLTGQFHVEYGFGMPKKVLRRMPMPYSIVLTREIEPPSEKRALHAATPEVPLLPGDFLWMVRYDEPAESGKK